MLKRTQIPEVGELMTASFIPTSSFTFSPSSREPSSISAAHPLVRAPVVVDGGSMAAGFTININNWYRTLRVAVADAVVHVAAV